jgi:hypothetical protein
MTITLGTHRAERAIRRSSRTIAHGAHLGDLFRHGSWRPRLSPESLGFAIAEPMYVVWWAANSGQPGSTPVTFLVGLVFYGLVGATVGGLVGLVRR